jgi:hypothetical protein
LRTKKTILEKFLLKLKKYDVTQTVVTDYILGCNVVKVEYTNGRNKGTLFIKEGM